MMRKLYIILLISIILLGNIRGVSADYSPPLYPPGSDVLPPGETMVQMLAERVVITIIPSESQLEQGVFDGSTVHVEAEFAMRNQGSATERMDARFPLTDLHGRSFSTLEDFTAFVNGQAVPVHESEEPISHLDVWPDIRWAVFPATFEPGQDVLIRVSYSMDISGTGWYTYMPDDPLDGINWDTAVVFYLLETGAGWHGPIESGLIVLRLPYEASPTNVFDFDTPLIFDDSWYYGRGEHLSPATFVGNEARWEFTDLEPTREDNLMIAFLWPGEWRRILALEAEAEQNPEDPSIAVKLAGAYLAAGGNTFGYASERHCHMGRQAIYRSLVYHPTDPELLEGLKLVENFCSDAFSPTATETVTESPQPSITPQPIAASTPTSAPTFKPTASPTPSLIHQTAEVNKLTSQDPSREDTEDRLINVQGVVGFGLGLLLAFGLIWVRQKPE